MKIGKKNTMRFLVLNDDEPGTFTFDKRSLYVKESCGSAVIAVLRENGADGTVEVSWSIQGQCNMTCSSASGGP